MPTFSAVRALAVLLALGLAGCADRMAPEQRIELARELLGRGDAPTAVIHLKNALQQDPSNVAARVLLGAASLQAGDYDSAAKEYLRALDLGVPINEIRRPLVEALVRAGDVDTALRFSDPAEAGSDPELAYWRGMALMRTGRTDEARAILEALDSPADLRDRARIAIARIELSSRGPDAALAILGPLQETLAGDPDFWEVQGHALLRSGRADEAVEAFRTAVGLVVDPLGRQRFMLRAGEAEALLAAGRLAEARAVAAELHGQQGRHPVSNYLMARVELQSGKPADALAHAQAMLAVQPDSAAANMIAGAASMSLGQAPQAERYLERAVAIEPGNLAARKLLAQTRLGLQSPERALEILGPALSGGDPSAVALAGLASVRAGDPDGAVDLLRGQLARTPEDDELRSMLVISLMSAGRLEEALAELAQIDTADQVVRQRMDLVRVAALLQEGDHAAARSAASQLAAGMPADVAVRNALGALFEGAGLTDEAAAWFEEAHALDPANSAATYNLGRIAANQGQLDRAAELFGRILARDPANAMALTAIAQVHWARGERDSAIERLQHARSTHPGEIGARFVLTQYLVAAGRPAEAVEVAREGAVLAPGSAPFVNALGVALMQSGDAQGALKEFGRALEINPLEPRYHLNSARARMALGEPGAAREHIVNGLAVEPDHFALLSALVEVERRAGRLDAAAQALVRLERTAPRDDPQVDLLRGEVLLAQQRFVDAERTFAAAARRGIGDRAAVGIFEARRRGGLPEPAEPLLAWLAERPDDLSIRALLADHYLVQGDEPGAMREYERLVELAPDNALFLNNLAWLYGESGDERALSLARRAHELAPENPMITDTYGWLVFQQGRHDEALALLASAVAGAPQAGGVRYRYAVALAETGDRAAAAGEARAVLADTGAANYHEAAQKLLNRLEQQGE